MAETDGMECLPLKQPRISLLMSPGPHTIRKTARSARLMSLRRVKAPGSRYSERSFGSDTISSHVFRITQRKSPGMKFSPAAPASRPSISAPISFSSMTSS